MVGIRLGVADSVSQILQRPDCHTTDGMVTIAIAGHHLGIEHVFRPVVICRASSPSSFKRDISRRRVSRQPPIFLQSILARVATPCIVDKVKVAGVLQCPKAENVAHLVHDSNR